MLKIQRILRKLPITPLNVGSVHGQFLEYFKGFDQVEAVKTLFGEKTTDILTHLKVEFTWLKGYMHVDGNDGHIVISRPYLQTGNKTDIYLDLIHELYHVKQFIQGKELFDPKYKYVDRPTEIQAYKYTIQEAKRIGLTDNHIKQYLKTEWINDTDFKQLLTHVGFNTTKQNP
jgi:hypothetical protein